MTGLVGTVRLFNHHMNVGYSWLAVIDFILFIGAGYLGSYLYFGALPASQYFTLAATGEALLFAAITTTAMYSMGLYEPKMREGLNGILLRVFGAFALTITALSLLFYVAPQAHQWRGQVALVSLLAFAAALTNRLLWTRLIDLDRLQRRVLVLGSGDTAATITRRMRRKADRRGFRIVGFVHQPEEDVVVEKEPTLALDCPLSEYVRKHDIDEVVVALEDRREKTPQEELMRCRALGVSVLDIVDFFEREAGKVLVRRVHPSWFTYSSGFQIGESNSISKRLFDVVMSFALLTVAWPFMLLTVLAIWLEDGFGAPVLYRQRRVGQGGRIYEVIKFRSMTVNAEKDGKAQWATANDSRVTRVGAIIRKTRIDELPQILNVMAGDMAFVGPRPERPEFVRELKEKIPYYEKRHCVKPGITGWAQMNYPYGASEEDTANKLEFDLYYVKHQSLFLDFLVLLQTAEVVLFGKGAR